MASFKLSALITDIKGKMQGSYFRQHNNTVIACSRGAKSTKADAGRSALQQSRNSLAHISQSWKDLTISQRLAWQSQATTLTWFSKVGNPYTPSGYQLFNKINLTLVSNGLPTQLTPLTDIPTTSLDNIAVLWNGDPAINVEYTAIVSDVNKVKVFASYANSAGVKVPKGGYKLLAVQNANALNGYILDDDIVRVFGVIPSAGIMFFKFVVSSNISGIEGITKTVSFNVIP